jgi:hypothetical protein
MNEEPGQCAAGLLLFKISKTTEVVLMIGRYLAGLGILFLLLAIPACAGETKSTSNAPGGPKANPVDASGIKGKPG